MEPDGAGTFIRDLEGSIKPRVVGVAHEEKIILLRIEEESGEDMKSLYALAGIFEKEGVKTKQMSFHPDLHGRLVGSLVIPEKENYGIEAVLERLSAGFEPTLRILRNCSAVSLIGTGITDRHTCLLSSLALLRQSAIKVAGLQTSSFRISFLTDRSRMAEAVQLFHRHFIEQPQESGPV
jgi:aspartokinase